MVCTWVGGGALGGILSFFKHAGVWELSVGSAAPPVMWDTFKATLRGAYISAIKASRVEHNQAIKDLQDRDKSCTHLHAELPSPTSLAELQMARWALLVFYQELTHCVFQKRVEDLFEKRKKNGKLLALLTASVPRKASC